MRFGICLLVVFAAGRSAAEKKAPLYEKDIAPLLRKYCVACHNPTDHEGKLDLTSYAKLLRGGKHGPAMTAGSARSSRMYRMVSGADKNQMPPDGSAQLKEREVELLKEWIDGGARGPKGKEPDPTALIVPALPAAKGRKPITSIDWSPDGKWIAVGRFRTVEIRRPGPNPQSILLSPLPGKVTSVRFSPNGELVTVATGVAGLYGEAQVWSLATRKRLRVYRGHRDLLYSAVVGPKSKLLATAGYDRRVILWNLKTGKKLREIKGHNGAVYDIAFSPGGDLLATASADETIKIWNVETGSRLDTLSQPQGAQNSVVFSPDGRFLYAGGEDNRIRRWRVLSRKEAKINPLTHARFAHEGAIVRLAFSGDGKNLLSLADDRTAKVWDPTSVKLTRVLKPQPAATSDVAAAPSGTRFVFGRMDGSLGFVDAAGKTGPGGPKTTPMKPVLVTSENMASAVEKEPNDSPDSATALQLPSVAKGVIERPGDVDLFRFPARAGEQWVFEIRGSRIKSPIDSKVTILDRTGKPIVRVKMQAVRDSYFTFRGKNSDTSDDFRVFNWEEMELNEYLYAGGEVVKLWLYPRGPDSGFKVYPGFGKRKTYFDTTAKAHALHAPCYVVRPLPADAAPVPNGLPIFPIPYENDDDAERKLGRDSRLTFAAPADGEYLVRVEDVRGFGGKNFKYELIARPRKPDFRVSISGANATVPPGAGREFTVRAERIDGFDGPIRVEIKNFPKGFTATNPIVIEPGQLMAQGTLFASKTAPSPPAKPTTTISARATIAGKSVVRAVNNLGTIKLAKKASRVRVLVLPTDGSIARQQPGKPWVLEVRPGETIRAIVRVERVRGFKTQVSFGKEDAGRNLPHGVYVDNIGLNGLLIVNGESQREFFITAAKWVKPTERLFHLRAGLDGNITSLPVLLRVRAR